MTPDNDNRVFWLGMHKLLTHTELPRLRRLGFEVFNPPYLSAVYDQSANRDIDWMQPTTLPMEVLRRLMAHDFFYTPMPPDIAEMLNAYFSTVVVTISSHWLRPMLKNFRGRIVYRLYGQHFSLSQSLVDNGLWHAIMSRDDFHIVPFAAESIENEHQWFIDLCQDIVPYHLDEDVSEYTDTWDHFTHRGEIMATMPNIDNDYFRDQYARFNARFPQSFFKLYGVQRFEKPDPRIAGTLERKELLRRFQTASGYYYHYQDQVCYLPPIEMMEIGGPVLYAPESLLARFYESNAPGLCRSTMETDIALRRLLNGDKVFVRELQAAQRPVRDRYRPSKVNPVFDRVFKRLLGPEGASTAAISRADRSGVIGFAASAPRRTLVVALHHNGLFKRRNGKVFAFEGIPRVIDAVIDAAIRHSDVHVVVTCQAAVADVLFDFFSTRIATGRMSLRVLNPVGLQPTQAADRSDDDATWPDAMLFAEVSGEAALRLAYSGLCASIAGQVAQFVPHYYLFPEAALNGWPMMLYLPDYFPHLFPDIVFDSSPEKDLHNQQIGKMLVSKSRIVLTASDYSANYLPKTALFRPEDASKIRTVWLPLLGEKQAAAPSHAEQTALEGRIGGAPYLFYPTANRPNKQIAFLLRVFAVLRERYPSLGLVLTGDLNSYPAAAEAARTYGITRSVTMLPQVSDSELRWLYENATALCLTSTMEGNFPPQIIEAMSFGAPVVATRLPVITEALDAHSDQMLLCNALDVDDFVAAVEVAIARRDEVLARQPAVLKALMQANASRDFSRRISVILDELLSPLVEHVGQSASVLPPVLQ